MKKDQKLINGIQILQYPGDGKKGIIIVLGDRLEQLLKLIAFQKLKDHWFVIYYSSGKGLINHKNILPDADIAKTVDLLMIGDPAQKQEKQKRFPETPSISLADSHFVSPLIFQPYRVFKKDYDIIMISRFHPCKRFELLFNALEKLKHYKVILLTGTLLDGQACIDYKHQMVKRIAELRNQGITIELIDQDIPHDRVNEYINRSKIGVLLSSQEGSPRVIPEMLFCDTPVLVLEDLQDGGRDFIKKFTGIICTQENLPAGLSYLVENYHKYAPRKHLNQVIGFEIANQKLKNKIKAIMQEQAPELHFHYSGWGWDTYLSEKDFKFEKSDSVKLSCIIIAGRNCDILKKCIYSLLEQKIAYRYEIIVLQTKANYWMSDMLTREFQSPIIKFYYLADKPDAWIMDTIKFGVSKASGEILCFAQDDCCYPEGCLNRMVEKINKNKNGVFFANYSKIYQKMVKTQLDLSLEIESLQKADQKSNLLFISMRKEIFNFINNNQINNANKKNKTAKRSQMLAASVVIPTYNNKHQLELILNALLNQDFNEDFEILICDDGSNDGTKKTIRNYQKYFRKLRYFWQADKGFRAGRARNMGLFNSRGEVVIFLDGDCIPSSTFIREHYASHKTSNEALVVIGCRNDCKNIALSSNIIIKNNNVLESAILSPDYRLPLEQHFMNLNVHPYCYTLALSANLSVKKEHLLAVGGFNHCFTGWGAEDLELSYKLFMRGLKFVFCKNASCYHLLHKHKLSDMESARRNELQFYKMYRTRRVAEGLIKLGNQYVCNEYKQDLVKLSRKADEVFEKSKRFWLETFRP